MEKCKKCGRGFVVTSWTRDRFWRGVCPRCIIALLEDALKVSGGTKGWSSPRPE